MSNVKLNNFNSGTTTFLIYYWALGDVKNTDILIIAL